MANLRSISRLNGSARGADALAIMLSQSPLLNALDSYSGFELDGTSYDWRPVTAASTAAARAIGATYTPAAITPGAKQTGSLAIHGDEIQVDVTHLADRDNGNLDMKVWFEKALKKRLAAFARAYEVLLLNGDGQTNKISGLKDILDGSTDLPGYTGVTGVTNAATFSTGTTPKSMDISAKTLSDKEFAAFLELLAYAGSQIDGEYFMYMNSTVYGRMTTIAQQKGFLDTNSTLFGVPVNTFGNVPMIVGVKDAITNTEPDDTATPLTETSSIYLMSPGEMKLSLVTNSGLEYWEFPYLEATTSGAERWEVRAAWKIEEANSIARIRNLKV